MLRHPASNGTFWEKQKQDKGKIFTTSKSITTLSSEIYLGSGCKRFHVAYVFSYPLKAIGSIQGEANAFLHIYDYIHILRSPRKAWSQAVISLSNISMSECRQRPCGAWQATWKSWLLLPQAGKGLDETGGRFILVHAPSGGSRKMPLMRCGLQSPHDHLGLVWLTAV